jgi:hypothetical protein
VQLIFDGAGPKWIPELEKPDHMAHGLYVAVKDRIGGACDFCSGAFGVKDKVVACGVELAGEYDGHPSFKKLGGKRWGQFEVAPPPNPDVTR